MYKCYLIILLFFSLIVSGISQNPMGCFYMVLSDDDQVKTNFKLKDKKCAFFDKNRNYKIQLTICSTDTLCYPVTGNILMFSEENSRLRYKFYHGTSLNVKITKIKTQEKMNIQYNNIHEYMFYNELIFKSGVYEVNVKNLRLEQRIRNIKNEHLNRIE